MFLYPTNLTAMIPRILNTPLLTVLSLAAAAQCSIGFPTDTVTIYWGYAPMACATLSPAMDGDAPVDVLWSTGSASASITVCDTSSGWYTVTLTDDTLCVAFDSVFVRVVDVRCGSNSNKVAVCHLPPGNPANMHTICIGSPAVAAHLAHGCQLGPCAMPADSIDGGGLIVELSPNPTSDVSTVRVLNERAQRVRVEVVDATGRVLWVLMEAEMTSGEQRSFTLNATSMPNGVSMAWVRTTGTMSGVRVDPVLRLQ